MTLQCLAHRGCWKQSSEQNTIDAFRRALDLGFGIETDIRDLDGTLMISHDPPTYASSADRSASSCPTTQEFFELYREDGKNLPLALNIKADGLHAALLKQLQEYEVVNYFVFDMSVPDMRHYLKSGFRVFSRHSDCEDSPAYYREAQGIWLDAFEADWFELDTIERHLARGKSVCVVSPELHQRNPSRQWEMLTRLSEYEIMLCTDDPEAAKAFFDD